MAEEDEYGMVEKNPNKGGEVALRVPKEIFETTKKLDEESAEVMKKIERQFETR